MTDDALGLVDDLLALARGSRARRIEVETETYLVAVEVTGPARTVASATVPVAAAAPGRQQVHATTVGIFSAEREWTTGDRVERGALLGAIQSLGHMAEVTAPTSGEIAEVLVTGGSPVEYGQPLFAIAPSAV